MNQLRFYRVSLNLRFSYVGGDEEVTQGAVLSGGVGGGNIGDALRDPQRAWPS